MHKLLTPALALAALGGLAFGVAPAASTTPDLETVPYMVEDLAGDGNGLNGQGLLDIVGVEVPATSTGPAQHAGSDILGARIVSQYDEVIGEDGLTDHELTGLEFRIGMGAEPAASGIPQVHRFIGTAGTCTFWMTVDTGTGIPGHVHGDVAINLMGQGCGIPDEDTGFSGSEYVRGDWATYAWDAEFGEMVMTLDLAGADQRLADRINRGDYYMFDEVHNRVATLITAPVMDEMTEDGFALIGDDIPADEEPAPTAEPSPEPTPEPSPEPAPSPSA